MPTLPLVPNCLPQDLVLSYSNTIVLLGMLAFLLPPSAMRPCRDVLGAIFRATSRLSSCSFHRLSEYFRSLLTITQTRYTLSPCLCSLHLAGASGPLYLRQNFGWPESVLCRTNQSVPSVLGAGPEDCAMTDAGFPPTESECKHMQQVSELDEQDLMTQRFKA